jgi:coniferyl-aldehyde dehydrogenase
MLTQETCARNVTYVAHVNIEEYPVYIQPTDSTAIAQLLSNQRAAFFRDGAPSLKQRRADLKRLKNAILMNKANIEAALKADFGQRSTHETSIMEVMTVVHGISYLHRHLRRWMRPGRRHVAMHFQPARSYVAYQPLGVVGIMSPWNYPLALALMPLATALAAGNRAMIKPSEFTPATSTILETILAKIFSPEQVAVLNGGEETGAAFSALPFDHIVFTGSTQVGRAVMKAAADNLVPVTLELGGKSPVIVEKGQAEAAAVGIAYGKLTNAGQTCIAPDYVMLREQDVQSFISAYDKAVKRLYPAGCASDDYTSIINDRQYSRLDALLEDAQTKGAQVIKVGVQTHQDIAHLRAMPPVLVLGVTDQMRIMQEEIFGPVLPVLVYDCIDEAINYINSRARPLALYYFGPAGEHRDKLLARTTSGNVTINNTLMHYAQDDLPFGGIGASGLGAYHGVEGFRMLSHAKGVFVQSRWNLGNMLRPPFGRMAELILKFMLR